MKKLSYLVSIGLLTSMLSLTGCGASEQEASTTAAVGTDSSSEKAVKDIPAEKVGLQGEHDRSGLAKRVLKAFGEDPALADVQTVYVAQTGSTVVLRGKVPNQAVLEKMVSVAREVEGVEKVETGQVTVNP